MAHPVRMTPDELLWAPEFLWTPREPTMDEVFASIKRIINEDGDHTATTKPAAQTTCPECSILRSRVTGLEFEISALRDLVRFAL